MDQGSDAELNSDCDNDVYPFEEFLVTPYGGLVYCDSGSWMEPGG